MIDQLIAALNQEMEFSAKDIADTIWLALQINPSPSVLTDNLPLLNNENQPPSEKDESQPEEKESLEDDRNENTNEDKNDRSEEDKAVISPSKQGQTLKNSELKFNAPNARSLREPLPLARALKPLMRRIPSGTNLVLDEIATTQQVANEGLWLPVLKPRVEPWLDLELLVDESISMQIWRSTIRELEKLLKNYGIFRNVRIWALIYEDTTNGLENQPKTSKISIRRGLGKTAKNQPLRSPKELIDPTNRRLLLLATDCVSDLWRNNEMRKILDLWANNLPMAIVQMLPRWLWERTNLGRESEIRLLSLTAGVANKSLIAKEISLWDELDEDKGIKMPIFTLEANRVGTWAEMLAGKGNVETVGYSLEKDISQRKSTLFNQNKTELTAEERVQRFRVTASPVSRKLAGLLSASPVISLPVVRLIRETMLPNSLQVNVAEVFLGGLLKPLSEINANTNPDTVLYDFMDGVRDLFLNSLPSDYVLTILDKVSQYIAEKAGLSLAEFTAVLRKQKVVSGNISVEKIDYFATITAQVLRSLGDEYAKFADDLEPDNSYSEKDTQTSSKNIHDFKYHLGGSLRPNSPSYVKRKADDELYHAIKQGDLCLVSAPRQMGKTSLILQVIQHLTKKGFVCAWIDLVAMGGSEITQKQFLYSFGHKIADKLELRQEFKSLVKEQEELPESIVITQFFEDVILKKNAQPIIIFIDEIDWIFGLDFASNFFSLLRSLYTHISLSRERGNNKDYHPLTFVLSGVFLNYDLIQDVDVNVSPFNIGRSIKLEGFTYEEALPLAKGLEGKTNNPERLLKHILEWTGGQPFLTQKLCLLVFESQDIIPEGDEQDWLNNLVRTKLIQNWRNQDEPLHFTTIENQILYSEQEAIERLRIYQKILQEDQEYIEDRGKIINYLMLTGLIIRKEGKFKVPNKIYAKIFNQEWIEAILDNLKKYTVIENTQEQTGNLETPKRIKQTEDNLGETRIKTTETQTTISNNVTNVNEENREILYRLYFGTNRKPINKNNLSQGFSIERDSQVNYGICDILIPLSHKIGSTGSSWTQRFLNLNLTDDRLKLKQDTIRLVTKYDSLVNRSENDEILVFIHGMNVNFENVAVRAAQIGHDLKFRGIMAFYSWPSQGKASAYIPDLKTLEASEIYIKEFLINLVRTNKVTKIHILAHSISNQTLLKVINQISTKCNTKINFGQIFLTGADVDPNVFQTLAPTCINLAERITLYVSNRDRALQATKKINGGVTPIGLYPPITIVEGIDTIDVSQTEDRSLLGHNYYADSRGVLQDMYQQLTNNTPPENRSGLESRMTEDNKIYWVMR